MLREIGNLLVQARSEVNAEHTRLLLKQALDAVTAWRTEKGEVDAYLLESQILSEQALNAQVSKDRLKHWTDAVNIASVGWGKTSDPRLAGELAARVVDLAQDPYSDAPLLKYSLPSGRH